MSMLPYVGNIADIALENKSFRKVLYTGEQLQLVAMCLKTGEDTGSDTHHKQDQIVRVEKGQAMVNLDGFEYVLTDNMAIVIPSGSTHNITNTSPEQFLYIHIVYCLPHHEHGKVHRTKSDSEKDKPKPPVVKKPAPKIVAKAPAKAVVKAPAVVKAIPKK